MFRWDRRGIGGCRAMQGAGDADFHALNSTDLQTRVSSSWRLQVRLIEKNERGAPLRESGLLWLSSHVLALTAAVREVVRPVLEAQGVFAPLRSGDGDFPDRLVGRTVFHNPQLPKGPLFCARRVVDALSGERGVGFEQVWPAPC